MTRKVRKAVFPAAGLGTRFLPATKAMPKEMLPLVDKPLIQYGVEEAMHSGVQNIIIVTGRGKSAIEDHFDVSFELEHLLETRHKKDLLATVRAVSDMIDVAYVRQKEALGLGHAVLRAHELVGDEPFAVILSDDIIDAETPCLRQLLDVYEFYAAPVLALMEVPRENISAYGVVDAEPVAHNGGRDRLYRIRNLVEKPKAEDAPSNLAIIGRYVLTPEIFHSLETIEPGSGGEIQLTDGLKHMLRSRPIYGYRFEGKRYDAGDKLGFLKATVEFALKRHDLGEAFRAYLKASEVVNSHAQRPSPAASRCSAALACRDPGVAGSASCRIVKLAVASPPAPTRAPFRNCAAYRAAQGITPEYLGSLQLAGARGALKATTIRRPPKNTPRSIYDALGGAVEEAATGSRAASADRAGRRDRSRGRRARRAGPPQRSGHLSCSNRRTTFARHLHPARASTRTCCC